MVSANGTVINHDICTHQPTLHYSKINYQIPQNHKTQISKPTAIHKKERNSTKLHESNQRETRARVWKKLPQAQRATAFHFLISKRLFFLVEEEGTELLEGSPAGTMGTSESKVAIASESRGIARCLEFVLTGQNEKMSALRLIYKLGFDTFVTNLAHGSRRPMDTEKII